VKDRLALGLARYLVAGQSRWVGRVGHKQRIAIDCRGPLRIGARRVTRSLAGPAFGFGSLSRERRLDASKGVGDLLSGEGSADATDPADLGELSGRSTKRAPLSRRCGPWRWSLVPVELDEMHATSARAKP
jgi:hypothetical protein